MKPKVEIMWALKLRLVLATCCAALVFPASAAAIHCAPPGVAGVDQYFEQIPASACNGSSSGPGGGGHHGSLPARTAAQLSKQGAVGQAVAGLVRSTGTGSNGHSGSKASTGTGSKSSSHTAAGTGAGAGQNLSSNGRNPVSGILHPVLTGSSSGGIGVLLPIIIIATLVLVLGTTFVRRRFRTSGPGT